MINSGGNVVLPISKKTVKDVATIQADSGISLVIFLL
jgi:hypothetical protein